MRAVEKILLYGRTIKGLKPVQVKGQIGRKIRRDNKLQSYARSNPVEDVRIAIPELDGDERYLDRFHIDGLLNNEIELLHEKHAFLGEWEVGSASHLWNFNFHYLEFTIPLAVRYQDTGNARYKGKWIEIISSWLENGSKQKDAWEAYTISLRIANVLIGLELIGGVDETLKKRIYDSLYDQYHWLGENLETALLANHYFENLKALVMGAIVFGEKDNYHRYWRLLLGQIDEQILPDGVHYERSPMYHKMILEDILRIYTVLRSAGRSLDAEKLKPAIREMAEAMAGLERGFRSIPLFNDSGDNISKTTAALTQACCRILDIKPSALITRTDFPDAGYYRIDHGNVSVLFDCGDIGPRYMGGHGHNDCLSFELLAGGRKIFSNSGTGQYQGAHRPFFRSTAAHNTVMLDEHEQNELWGEHRAARRATGFAVSKSGDCISGTFRTFMNESFRRTLRWDKGKLQITDEAAANGEHIARQFFHLVPGLGYERAGASVHVTNGKEKLCSINIPAESDYLIHKDGEITNYASEFGRYEHKQVLEIRSPFRDKVRIRLEIEING